jgi:sulfonate transport system permease protein
MAGGHIDSHSAAGGGGLAPARRTRRGRPGLRIAGDVALGLVVPAGLLLAWQLSSSHGWLPDQILPSPETVLDTFTEGVGDGSLLSATLTSLRRVAEGFAAGALSGVVVGGAIGLSKPLRSLVDPVFLALSQVPVLGWLPILILLVGIDEELKIIIIGWSAFVPAVLNTSQGVRDVPAQYVELGRVLAFSRSSTLGTIVLPSAAPSIFTGLREGLANSWQTLVAVELLASFEGLGYLMAYGRQLFQLELVLVAMVIIGLIGLVFHGLLTLAEGRLQRWRVEASR